MDMFILFIRIHINFHNDGFGFLILQYTLNLNNLLKM